MGLVRIDKFELQRMRPFSTKGFKKEKKKIQYNTYRSVYMMCVKLYVRKNVLSHALTNLPYHDHLMLDVIFFGVIIIYVIRYI